MSGIMWVGLLYYFNFVQADALKAATADGTSAGITSMLHRALCFLPLGLRGDLAGCASLLGKDFVAAFTLQPEFAAIGIGAWLGTIMLLNVWGLIWPNQKKILASNQPATRKKPRRAA